jgi:replicative DNA helicase
MTNDSRRLPPQDLDAERSVLGALMLNSDAFADVIDIVRADDFYSLGHSEIFNATMKLFSDGLPVDAITTIDQLRKTGHLEKAGGDSAIWNIVEAVPSAANVTYYAEIVREKSILRNIINAGVHIQNLAYQNDGTEIAELVDIAQEEVFELSDKSMTSDIMTIGETLPSVKDAIKQAANAGEVNGVSTGLKDLDSILHGLKGGQMIVVAARPGVGKSTLSNNIAANAVFRQKVPTLLFNLEMSYSELVPKVISAELSIDNKSLKTGRLKPEEWERIDAFEKRVNTGNNGQPLPLFIDDSPGNMMMQIRTKCRRVKSSPSGLGLVIIDYIGLLVSGKPEFRQQEMAAISRKIKLLAKELNVPIIAVAQLNRESEKASGRLPQLSDLRETGAIEQDADIVILIHREEMRHHSDEDDQTARRGEADIIVAKNRSGQTDEIVVSAQMHLARFRDMFKDMEM